MWMELANVIARPLLIFLNNSCQSEEVPEDRKEANVTPVLKMGKEK